MWKNLVSKILGEILEEITEGITEGSLKASKIPDEIPGEIQRDIPEGGPGLFIPRQISGRNPAETSSGIRVTIHERILDYSPERISTEIPDKILDEL